MERREPRGVAAEGFGTVRARLEGTQSIEGLGTVRARLGGTQSNKNMIFKRGRLRHSTCKTRESAKQKYREHLEKTAKT